MSRNRPNGRPGAGPLLGYCKSPRLWSVLGVMVLDGVLMDGARVIAPVWCFDNILDGAKTRTIHTQAGRIKVPPVPMWTWL